MGIYSIQSYIDTMKDLDNFKRMLSFPNIYKHKMTLGLKGNGKELSIHSDSINEFNDNMEEYLTDYMLYSKETNKIIFPYNYMIFNITNILTLTTALKPVCKHDVVIIQTFIKGSIISFVINNIDIIDNNNLFLCLQYNVETDELIHFNLDDGSSNIVESDDLVNGFITIIFAIIGCLVTNKGDLNKPYTQNSNIISDKRFNTSFKTFYEFRTLHIKPRETPVNQHLTTEIINRISPKMHERRGHIRKLKSGKIVFVRSTVVGNCARGIIDSNYSVLL